MDLSEFPEVPAGFARVFYYHWNAINQSAELKFHLYPHHEGMTIRELRLLLLGTFIVDLNAGVIPNDSVAPTDGMCAAEWRILRKDPGEELERIQHTVVERLVLALPWICSTMVELPYSCMASRRSLALLRDRRFIGWWAMITHMWRTEGLSAFVRGAMLFYIPIFTTDALTAYLMPLPYRFPDWLICNLCSLFAFTVAMPFVALLITPPERGATVLSSVFAFPPLQAIQSLLRRAPDLLPLIFLRDWIKIVAFPYNPWRTPVVQTLYIALLQFPVRLIERCVLFNEGTTAKSTIRKIWNLPSYLLLSSMTQAIVGIAIRFFVELPILDIVNQRMAQLLKTRTDKQALNRITVELGSVIAAPCLALVASSFWDRRPKE